MSRRRCQARASPICAASARCWPARRAPGRDHLTPADTLAVQTDIYSEMGQEMGHRLATAIDHAPNADDRLHEAADLLDGSAFGR